jgi:DNA-binding NtrC family response regulator
MIKSKHCSSHATVVWALARGKSSSRGPIGKSRSKPVRKERHSKRILVIDDERAIADSLTEILADSGYEALAFYDGYAAIDSAKAQCPDAVISDVVMPKLNGVDTVVAIQKICPNSRVLLFSGQAGVADILANARARGHSFELIPKPIHPDQLLRKLSALGGPSHS